jgi:hypothetical protein
MHLIYITKKKEYKMKLIVKIKNVYGKDLIYPVCDKAKIFTSLMNKKTIDNYDIRKIKELGYSLEVQAQTL